MSIRDTAKAIYKAIKEMASNIKDDIIPRQQDSEIRMIPMEYMKWQQAKENEPETVSDIIESVKVEICDKYCKKPYETKDEADLIKFCEKCPLGRLG